MAKKKDQTQNEKVQEVEKSSQKLNYKGIPEQAHKELLNYLSNRPFAEVEPLINSLRKAVPILLEVE